MNTTGKPGNQGNLKLATLWFGAGFLLLVFIAIGSLLPGPDIGGSDKIMHLVTYALVSAWFSLLVEQKRSLWFVLLGLIGYGLGMEFLQGLTNYRMQDMADALANSIGVLAGLIFHFTPLHRALRRIDELLYTRFQ